MNKRCVKAFNIYLKEEESKKTTSYGYNSQYYQYGGSFQSTQKTDANVDKDRCLIFFYEWSNVSSASKTFTSKKTFFEFLNESKITITPIQKDDIEKNTTLKSIFITCIPSQSRIIMADTWYNLNELLITYKMTSNN